MDVFDKFQGTEDYIVSPNLKDIVNVAVALQRPLLVRGEPGTGKTLLAHSIAKGLNKRLIVWNIKSTTKAKDGLYVYDTVQRLYDSRFGDKDVSNIKNYIHLGKLGESFNSEDQVVLLIDEIDKADLEFPNDLLNELDDMSFYIYETDETIKAIQRPIVIITSNNEKELPDAFLRRCIFHYIEFPDPELMERIIYVHHPDVRKELVWQCLEKFYKLRKVEYLRKKPSTSELIDWIGVLIKAGITESELTTAFPFLGTLIKKEQDYDMLVKEKSFGGERNNKSFGDERHFF
jgi:MoxR-like ATPase